MRTAVRLIPRLLAAAGIAALMLLPAAAAQAEPPVTIPAGQNITDDANVLGSRKAEVQDAIGTLLKDHKYNLYVVIVNSFDGQKPTDWATTVAQNKQMGSADVLLAIATEGEYALIADSGSSIYSKIPAISHNAVVANLGGGKKDYAQAAIDTARAVGDAAGGGSGSVPDPTGGYVALGVGGVVVVGGVGTALALRNRKKKKAADATAAGYGPAGEELDPMAGVSIPELRKRAGALLIAADDAIKSSEQEIGFAQASYGDEAVKPFQAALADAKGHLTESFKLQQQLDDEIPDTIEEQRTWLGDIIRRSEAANAALQEQKANFDALRELEKNAPHALAAVNAGAADVSGNVDAAQQQLTVLADRYADTALAPVRDNIAQAGERLEFVRTASATAQQKLDAGDTPNAAVAVRAAEESLSQAKLLLNAIGKVSADLDTAHRSLKEALAETTADLVQAKALAANSNNQDLSSQVASVDAVVGHAQRQLAAGKVDPVATLHQVETAHASLDTVLDGIRDRQQQAQRARSALQQAIVVAQGQISATQDYIAARRGGVGSEARTRIAEAERNLDYALTIQTSDPVSALTYAQQANTLAQQAAQQAQSDVNGFTMTGGGGYGGYGGGYGRGRGGFGGGFGGA
ncbi:MAG: TPM domain-containing protein, partial [Actinomycetales bacterium]